MNTIIVHDFTANISRSTIKIPNNIKRIKEILFSISYAGNLIGANGVDVSFIEVTLAYPNWNNADFRSIPVDLKNTAKLKDAFKVNIPIDYLNSELQFNVKQNAPRPNNATNLIYKAYLICEK